MKLAIISLISLLSFTGCSFTTGSFTHLSSLETRARGVSLSDNGEFAQVGMFDNTCQVVTSTSVIGNDLDLVVGQADFVQDFRNGLTISTGNNSQIVVVDNNLNQYNFNLENADSINHARITESGFVVLSENSNGCNVTWLDDNGRSKKSTPADCNMLDFDVDPITENIYMATPDGIKIGWENNPPLGLDISADIVSYDYSVERLYAANIGQTTVEGISPDSSEWITDVGLPITAIDSMGTKGNLLVMAGYEDFGTLFEVDGSTGDIKSNFVTPSSAKDISVSDSGSILAIMLEDEIHFFQIN